MIPWSDRDPVVSLSRQEWLMALFHKKIIPSRIAVPLVKRYAQQHAGQWYVFKTKVLGREMVHGGIFGWADFEIFNDLNRYEAELRPLLRKIFERIKNPVVFDVGAHTGESLLIFKALSPDAQIHCFEPLADFSRFLEGLARMNRFRNVFVEPCCAGEREGKTKLFFKSGATDTASTLEGLQPFFNTEEEVNVCTLDGYFSKQGLCRMDLLKIDVELGELEVLNGARGILQRFKPDIVMELLYCAGNPAHFERFKKTVALLKSFGYRFFHIQKDGRCLLQEEVSPDPAYRLMNYFVSAKPLE